MGGDLCRSRLSIRRLQAVDDYAANHRRVFREWRHRPYRTLPIGVDVRLSSPRRAIRSGVVLQWSRSPGDLHHGSDVDSVCARLRDWPGRDGSSLAPPASLTQHIKEQGPTSTRPTSKSVGLRRPMYFGRIDTRPFWSTRPLGCHLTKGK